VCVCVCECVFVCVSVCLCVCVCVSMCVGGRACLCVTPIQLLKLSVSLSETWYVRCGGEMTYGILFLEDISHYSGINLVET